MRLLVIAVLGLLASLSLAEENQMTAYFDGSKVGFVNFERKEDGSFASIAELNLGSAVMKSSITGKYEGDKIVSYTSVVENPGTPKQTYTFDHGKATMVGQPAVPTRDLPDLGKYLGNIHPHFAASFLKGLDPSKTEPQTIKVLFLDTPAAVDLKVKPSVKRTANGKTVQFFTVTIGTVNIDFGLDGTGTVVAMDVPSQRIRILSKGWESLFEDPLKAFPELSQPTFETTVDAAVKMKTRDGVELVADVIRPSIPGKYPVILMRTPYGRQAALLEGKMYAERGYVFVSQDCRGRGDSAGEWDPFVHERKDGYDSVQWASALPYADGKVGMIGASYGGLVQWAAAVEQPPALKCMISQVPPPDAFRNLPFDMGVFFLYGNVWWAKIVRGKNADMSGLMGPLPHPEKLTTLPLSKVDDEVLGYDVPLYDKWLERETMADWKGFDYVGDLNKVKIPVLHISGWWDGDLIGTQTMWAKLRALGHKDQWLIYGPWGHAFNTEMPFTDISYGPKAVIEINSSYLRWFDTYLKGKDVKQASVPKVRAFLTGANEWIESSDWPLTQSTTRTLYLSASGPANGADSKGTLEDRPTGSTASSLFTYDPAAETVPKEFLEMDQAKASTIIDPKDFRMDQLTFVTAPLAKPLAIGGPITLTLTFSSSAKDTDLCASLYDVDENGVVRVFGRPGKIRTSYRDGFDKRVPLEPGKTYTVTIELWDTLHQLGKGHRLGVMVNSTLFPTFSRNLGTGEPIKEATRMVSQTNTIFHDASKPSFLTFQELARP